MGLAEKRAVQDFQNSQFPNFKNQLQKLVGTSVEIDVDWNSLVTEGEGHLFAEGFAKVYFEPLILALTEICKDKMGMDALHEQLKKIQICNKSNFYSPRTAVTFTDGVLKIDHLPTSNMNDIDDRKKAIQAILEKAL